MTVDGPPGTAELQLGISGDEGNKPGWHSRGYLPHCDADGLIQHITFHLADSLPKAALDHLERSIAEMPEDEKKRQRRQRDYWDRFIRNERHLLTAIRYIEENPVAAGLVGAAEDWLWGSARRRR